MGTKAQLGILLASFLMTGACLAAEKADLVVVHKGDRTLLLLKNGQEIGRFSVALGGEPKGHKLQEGDQRTPEGRYVLDYKKSDSAYYKSIHISYPNSQDSAQARKRGVSPGGYIMIHGQRNWFGWLGGVMQYFDWTDGCIAVKNAEMDQIWEAVDAGTPIQINP